MFETLGMRLGIYMMWFAVVVSGLGAFGVAAAYAWRPSERKLMLMRPLSLASVFSAIGSLTAGMATILKGAAATGIWSAGGVSAAAARLRRGADPDVRDVQFPRRRLAARRRRRCARQA